MIAESKQKTLNLLKTWLLNLEANSGLEDIDPDMNLIENGIIDSLEFVNFLLVVEEERGAEISSMEMELEKFRTLNAIIENYF